MNLPQPGHSGYSLEEWETWDGRWELIGGVAYDMTPSPSYEHQEVSASLLSSLYRALKAHRADCRDGHCQVLAAPVDVFLPSGVFIPDLVIVCDPEKITPRGIEGAPDLVLEILSPSTAGKDHSTRRRRYESAGIPEYLIVDPDERIGLLLRLNYGRYQEAARVEWGSVVALLDGRLPVTLG